MTENHNGFEPDITAFGCIFCGYMAADTAGTLGWEYPSNVKYVKLPCTGKIDIRYILAAFEQGADGVYVVAHVGSASTSRRSDFVVYHGHRNLVWTYFKDMPASLLWLYLPLHLLMNLYYLVTLTFKGSAGAIWRAKRDGLLGIPAALRKRRSVQGMRTAPAGRLQRAMSRGLRDLLFQRAQRRRGA